MQTFTCSPEQAEEFKVNMVKAMVTGCVPFAFVENEYMKQAMRSVGAKPPSRRGVAGSYLDCIFEAENDNSTRAHSECQYTCASSDGWRKRYCEAGASLMNFTALPGTVAFAEQLGASPRVLLCIKHVALHYVPCRQLCVGEVLLFDVRDCSSMRKSGSEIATVREEVALRIVNDKADQFAGWVIDNTRANLAALDLLETSQSSWKILLITKRLEDGMRPSMGCSGSRIL